MSWWRDAVFYQIYPRSFLDTDGDGVGDLEGIRQKVSYLAALGVDCVWLSPIFPSPMADFGYDVSDYCDIDPLYGDLAAFDRLVAECHDAGLRVILDWVPNHTSEQHPWFVDACRGRDSEHRDFYVWRDPGPNGELPNNWLRSWFDEPAWTLDASSGQYYLHCFLPEQPDLNWANPAVREAMADTLRFWLDRGVDGFRMDVIHLIGKDPALPNDPDELRGIGHVPLNDVAVTHDYLREIRGVLDSYDNERMSVGEVYLLDPEAVATYYGRGDELHLSFNFASLITPWRAEAWRSLIERTEAAHAAANAWPTWTLSNHDNQRVATRLKNDPARIRSAAVLLLTLRGSPFIYAGEELGMLDAEIPPDRRVDPGQRDGCRAPIPWTAGLLHGWGAEPWLPFGVDAEISNVEKELSDPRSVLSTFRELLNLRRANEALRQGELTNLAVTDDLLQYSRETERQRIDVVVNFSKETRSVELGELHHLFTTEDSMPSGDRCELGAGHSLVIVR